MPGWENWGMQKPAWKEATLEGRLMCMTRLTDEVELETRVGTRWPVYARVEILSGLFEGQVYDRVPIYSPPLKAQLLSGNRVTGRLGRGAALEGAPVQWVLKETAA